MSSDDRRGSFLAELSWFQVVAGALAAMTAAWVASALGVGGTIVGAALGSLVVTISSAFYSRTLDRTRTLVVQTDSGTFVETEVEEGHTAEALAAVRDATHEEVRGAEVVDETRRTIRWKVVALTTVVVLAISGVAIGAYELATDRSYGVGGDNAKIGNPFGGGSSASETPGTDDGTTTDEPAPDVTTPTPTATTPTPSADPTPTPTTPTRTPDTPSPDTSE